MVPKTSETHRNLGCPEGSPSRSPLGLRTTPFSSGDQQPPPAPFGAPQLLELHKASVRAGQTSLCQILPAPSTAVPIGGLVPGRPWPLSSGASERPCGTCGPLSSASAQAWRGPEEAQLRALRDSSERKGTGRWRAGQVHRTKARDPATQAIWGEGQCRPAMAPLTRAHDVAAGCPTWGKIAGWTRRGARSCGPDVRKLRCPSHCLLIPPFCFHLLYFLLNSLPRLKVSISGLGPKVKFFGNFRLSSFSYY